MPIKDIMLRGGRDLERPYGPSALLAPDNSGTVIMEDAHILFRNFAGVEKMYNREGDRNFCVLLHPEIAEDMIKDGWNVKQLKDREDGTPGDWYLQVSIKFEGRDGKPVRPPKLVLISSRGRTEIDQHMCDMLDWVDILKADLIIRPYNYNVNGKTGLKAYCKTLFITIVEDFLELKYSDVPDAEELPEIPEDMSPSSADDEGVYDISSIEED